MMIHITIQLSRRHNGFLLGRLRAMAAILECLPGSISLSIRLHDIPSFSHMTSNTTVAFRGVVGVMFTTGQGCSDRPNLVPTLARAYPCGCSRRQRRSEHFAKHSRTDHQVEYLGAHQVANSAHYWWLAYPWPPTSACLPGRPAQPCPDPTTTGMGRAANFLFTESSESSVYYHQVKLGKNGQKAHSGQLW